MKGKAHPERDRMLLSSADHSQPGLIAKSNKFLSLRFFISFLSLLGCAVMYMTRNNLNVAIVDMVTTVQYIDNDTQLEDGSQCPKQLVGKSNASTSGEFSWSPSTQGIVIGSFYYGQCASMSILLC